MASLTIRNLDETLKTNLRLQAAQHGWSMEQEVREILRQSVMPAVSDIGFAQKIHQRFADYELDALSIPERRTAHISDMTEE
ncbi:MAG: pantothenate metabolism flavoprotein [Methylophilaceae bacterium]|nr:pantothenate metabolism flavoprotein [Methylophilaceae bacterium]